MGAADVHLYEGHRIRDRDGVAPADVVRLADSPVALAAWMLDHDARSYEDIARAFDGGPVGNLTRDEVPRQHHAHLGDEHRGFLRSSLLGEQARLLRRQGRLGTGCRERLPSRDLSGAAELDRAGLPQPHLLQRSCKGNHFAAWQEPNLFTTEVRAAFRSLR